MILQSIESTSLAIAFNAAFRHAGAERSTTQSVWVEARSADGSVGYGEGCPREYVTAESVSTAHAFIARHRQVWLDCVHDVETLDAWRRSHRAQSDANPAGWCAVELALLDLLGKHAGQSVEAVLRLPELDGSFLYTAVIGDLAPERFEAQLTAYLAAGFRDLKIKLAGDPVRDAAKVRALRRAGLDPARVRADANNLWPDAAAAIRDLASLEFPFSAVEEPIRPGDYEGLQRIASALGTRIVLDESLARGEQLDALTKLPGPWVVNLRVSKMGGLLRSLEVVSAARERGLHIVVGAHVGETSLLTRAALTVASCARDLLAGQEGAFGTHLLARDMVDPPIMFGRGGRLDAAAVPSGGGGFSLDLCVERDGALA